MTKSLSPESKIIPRCPTILASQFGDDTTQGSEDKAISIDDMT